MEEREERAFPTHPAALAEIRRWVRERAAQAGVSVKTTEELALAVNEAAANALMHSGSPDIFVSWAGGEKEVVLQIRDRGVFKRRVPLPQVEGPGGYGIHLMMSLMDQVEIAEGTARYPGTAVRLVKRMES